MMNSRQLINLILFFIFPIVHGLVEIELSILQFDNPLGTSYTGQNLNSARKCCDTGGSNCKNTSDTCDVYFTFCIGSLSHSPDVAGCNGTAINMSKDVSRDVFKITDTREMKRFVNASSWIKNKLTLSVSIESIWTALDWMHQPMISVNGSTSLIANVLDLDEIPSSSNDPHVFPDMIDAFSKVVDFEPSQNFWSSEQHVLKLVGHVSLDIGIRVWCAKGWYGRSCDHICAADKFHECSMDSMQVPLRECIYSDTLVLSLRMQLSDILSHSALKRNITYFLADSVCMKNTSSINISIYEIREQRSGFVDIVFDAFCDSTSVSSLKLREVLYVSEQVKTSLASSENYFRSPAIPPMFNIITDGHVETRIIYLVRIVRYENKMSQDCSERNTGAICYPYFTVSFPDGKTVANVSAFQTNTLTDCDGVISDVGKSHIGATTTNSTSIYLSGSFHKAVFVVLGDLEKQNFKYMQALSLYELVVGNNFYDSYPLIISTSNFNNATLTIEIMAWCSNCWQGQGCENKSSNCNREITELPPNCIVQAQCKHGGRCVDKKCQCLQGWIGPTCNTDIDECALGVCEHTEMCANLPGGYTCTCSTGFTGRNCEEDVDECVTDPCKSGNECLNTFGGYLCIGVCADNTANPNCTGNINFCLEEPCHNNATCVTNAYNYTCNCLDGWSGPKCQTFVDECTNSLLCQNGGTCTASLGSFTCKCPSYFTGTYCDSYVGDCTIHLDLCSNNGTCTNTPGGFDCICQPGYTGKICEVDVDECLTQDLCRNNGTCVNIQGGYTCSCSFGYSGQNCQQDIDECADSGSCNNNGTCKNTYGGYTCSCLPGYTGNSCDNDVNECLLKYCQHGKCSNVDGGYTCVCEDGWEGQDCSVDRDECSSINPCFNGGTCINNPGSYTCNCTEYWKGQHCQDDVDECLTTYACHYNGNCTNTKGSFTCSCYSGWTGVTCINDINECLSSPCHNSGTCNNTKGGYSCICPSKWEGENCDQDVNECNVNFPCEHGGTCLNVQGSYNCNCTSNWTGFNCTDDINECMYSGACGNGGSCVNTAGSYLCNCLPQWTGPRCETDVNECQSQPCLNGGTCLNAANGYSCSCTSAWTGQNCSDNVDECQPNAGICVHGVCHDIQGSYSCDCIPGYEGKNCSIDINECSVSGLCQNGGTCENMNGSYVCHCLEGWQGINCTEFLNECLSQNPCNHSGVCGNINGSFNCLCQQGWTGKTCETDIDECVDTPCLHSGTCVNNNGNFTCNCASGWEGNTCENNTDECIAITCKNGGACQDSINDFVCVCQIGYTGKLCDIDIDDCASQPCNNGGTCHDHTAYYECVCPEGWNGTRCSEDVDECWNHPCGGGETCQIIAGSFMCVKAHFAAVSKATTTASSAKPFMVDVFSLEFVGPISDDIKPKIREGIVRILKLLICHDSTTIDVSLVQNSITVPNTVEFHAQCDGQHLTNEQVNDAIRTLSDDKLMQYFPVGLKNSRTPPEKQNWLLTHIPVVVGGAGGLLVLIIIIITVVCVKKRKARIEENVQFSKDIVEPINDMDGQATITIRNPVYDSIYPHQTQI